MDNIFFHLSSSTFEKIFQFCLMNGKYAIHIRAGDLSDVSSALYLILYLAETVGEIWHYLEVSSVGIYCLYHTGYPKYTQDIVNI